MKPFTKIDLEKMKMLARLRATLEDCAAFFECSTPTIKDWLKREHGLTYTEFKERQMVHTKLSLTQKALELANKGDKALLIFCLKNICGWTDLPIPQESAEIPRSIFSIVPKAVDPSKESQAT